MGDNTAIEWTDATWNPVTGCSRLSPACTACYAEALSRQKHKAWLSMGKTPEQIRHAGWTSKPWTAENAAENIIIHEDRFDQPLRWKRPRRVFVNSVSDFWHPEIPDSVLDILFSVMADCPRHTFQILTKRPARMRAYLHSRMQRGFPLHRGTPFTWPLPNVWLGVSVEMNGYLWRADQLGHTPAAVRFLSCEPLLGDLFDLRRYLNCWRCGGDGIILGPRWDAASRDDGDYAVAEVHCPECKGTGQAIHWVIAGGESGPGPWERKLVRPALGGGLEPKEWALDAARAIRDTCVERGVAMFWKQWGGPTPKAGGRLLDGQEWNQYPKEVARVA